MMYKIFFSGLMSIPNIFLTRIGGFMSICMLCFGFGFSSEI
jgi:hypothetical protein